MQFRDGTIATEPAASADDACDESRKWFVRLRIRDDRLAKLWVWKLADHDVIVWSEAEERWKKLLAVPELRAAVRQATTSAYARKNAPSERPPQSTKRRSLHSLSDMTAEEPPTRVRRPLSNLAIPEDEDSPTRVRQRVASTPPPRPVDSFLRALSTSIPPAVHSNPAPAIPRAPRLPSFAFQSPQPSVKPRAPVLIEPMRFRSVPRAVSQFSIKNISWAMMPIACAGVFAAYLSRAPMVSYGTLAVQQGAAPVGAAAAPGAIDPTNVGLATLLAGLTPMCSGQPQLSEPPKVISPDQLANVSNLRPKGWGSATHFTKAPPGAVPTWRKAGDKSPTTLGGVSAAASPSADTNEFDKDGARTALSFAIARVRNCSNSGLSGSALITFATSGTVQSVQLSQLVGDDVDPSCVTRSLSAARVPPFTGNAVTVRKSF